MKILHLPLNVAGASSGLAAGERAIGHDSKTLSLESSRFGFGADYAYDAFEGGQLRRVFTSLKVLASMRSQFDLYNFYFGSSLLHFPRLGLPHLDLSLYTGKAKKIFTYQGCDARQKFPTMSRLNKRGQGYAGCFEKDCYGGSCNSGKRDDQRKKAIEKAAKYADHMFALNPDLLFFLPKEKSSFLPYAIDNFETILEKTIPFFEKDTIHIVHAPTDKAVKGTKYVISAIEALKEEYSERIVFTKVEGVNFQEARRIYSTADIFIDQLLVGWYGGVSVEVMKMGIPVVCYINDDVLDLLPSGMASNMPFVRADPSSIFQVLRELIEQRDQIPERGQKGIEYVKKWHDPATIAKMELEKIFG